MKITKSQLREIIREEIQRLNENILDTFYQYFFGIKRGDILLQNRRIYVVIEPVKKNDKWVSVFNIGTISKDTSGNPIASLIFNTQDTNVVKILNSSKFTSYTKPSSVDKKLIKNAIKSGEYDKYLNILFQKTGIKIKN